MREMRQADSASGLLPPLLRSGGNCSEGGLVGEVTLLAALVAFVEEHRCCGELDGGVEGDRVWLTCECGAGLLRSLRADRL